MSPMCEQRTMYKYTLYTVHAIQDRPRKSLGSCPKGRKAAQVGLQVARSNKDPVKTPPDAKVNTESGQPRSARQTQDKPRGPHLCTKKGHWLPPSGKQLCLTINQQKAASSSSLSSSVLSSS